MAARFSGDAKVLCSGQRYGKLYNEMLLFLCRSNNGIFSHLA